MQEERVEQKKLNWLATLRGVAAFLVFISHLFHIHASGEILFVLGRIGVVCFFLMTGYLTMASRDKRNGKQYLWNRFLRVYPIYWLLLLITVLLDLHSYSVKSVVLNATLFEEFFGEDAIIGASWMLPIQVVFFIGVALFGFKLFINKNNTEKSNMQHGMVLISICMIVAVAIGGARRITGKPFPTAFLLLVGLSVLGIYYQYVNGNIKKIAPLWIIYEVCFLVSVVLSYPGKAVRYIVAYNIGIVLFVIFEKLISGKGLISSFFSKIGRIGFTFFLGAGIPWTLMLKISTFDGSIGLKLLGCILKFCAAVLLGYVITRFIEEPLLRWGKKVEKKME